MDSFALYRLPDHDHVTRIASHDEPRALSSCKELSGQQGFAVAPFTITASEPLLLIKPDEVKSYLLPAAAQPEPPVLEPGTLAGGGDGREAYHRDFERFHDKLTSGEFQKIVLARQMRVATSAPVKATQLFYRACNLYPHQMVTLVHTATCGTWLMATPEVMLSGSGGCWHTVALAGTMKGCDEHAAWSVKNIREQRLVATYVYHCLARYASNIEQRGPMTARAGALLHLKSTFDFTLESDEQLGPLLDSLYPTPAVCGLPKQATRDFIAAHETTARSYYSGFAGPLGIDGATHLYVSLRCMRIDHTACTLYAGGGILSDSVEQQEWEETQAKMGTMLRLLTT